MFVFAEMNVSVTGICVRVRRTPGANSTVSPPVAPACMIACILSSNRPFWYWISSRRRCSACGNTDERERMRHHTLNPATHHEHKLAACKLEYQACMNEILIKQPDNHRLAKRSERVGLAQASMKPHCILSFTNEQHPASQTQSAHIQLAQTATVASAASSHRTQRALMPAGKTTGPPHTEHSVPAHKPLSKRTENTVSCEDTRDS